MKRFNFFLLDDTAPSKPGGRRANQLHKVASGAALEASLWKPIRSIFMVEGYGTNLHQQRECNGPFGVGGPRLAS